MKRRRIGGARTGGRKSGGGGRAGAGRAGGGRPGGGRVIALTAARRRAVEKKRAAALLAARKAARSGGATGVRGLAGARGATGAARAALPRSDSGNTIDFHLATAVAAARAGGRVLLDFFGRRGSIAVREKGPSDYVTIADRTAEAAVVRMLRDRFPGHAVIAEESSPGAGSPGYRWYVDPLDGTTNFIHGVPMFAVSIGLADAQGMRVGVVFDPVRDEMFTAARGQGAHLNGAPIQVARPGRLAHALVVTGIPFRSVDRLEQYLASFRAFIHQSSGIRRDGSAALDLAYVACGRYDGFWEMGLSSWDVAAGSLLVNEAGGVVTDFVGRPGYIGSGDIVAASPDVHPAMLKIVRDAYGR